MKYPGIQILPAPCKFEEAYVNEEDILLGLPPNQKGAEAVGWPEMLFGPVVVVETIKQARK